jgi:hypothetical protein
MEKYLRFIIGRGLKYSFTVRVTQTASLRFIRCPEACHVLESVSLIFCMLNLR